MFSFCSPGARFSMSGFLTPGEILAPTIEEMSPADRQATDANAFESLLEPQLESAYGMALKLTRHAADAEDLVQEAALLAFRGFHTFEM